MPIAHPDLESESFVERRRSVEVAHRMHDMIKTA
jgi:hypothetical protein